MRDLTSQKYPAPLTPVSQCPQSFIDFCDSLLLLPPKFLSFAVLILSFVAMLSLPTLSLSPSTHSYNCSVAEGEDVRNSLLSKRGSFIAGDTSSSRSDLFISFGFY